MRKCDREATKMLTKEDDEYANKRISDFLAIRENKKSIASN